MSWILLTLISAVFLGLYEVSKKSAVRENAVLPVLFLGILTSALVWLPFTVLSAIRPENVPYPYLFVDPLDGGQHLLLFFKALLVGSSWVLGYFSLKHLPISIAAPIRATSPIWVVLAAVLFAGERPSPGQWLGVGITLTAFYTFSLVGKREGIHFHRDVWIGLMVLSSMLSAGSALYDKFLFQTVGLSPPTVQAWFSIYLVVYITPFVLLWKRGSWARSSFHWRWSIPLVGLLLLVADIFYYTAIQDEGALISIISVLRRSSVVISFLAGIVLYRERNLKPKGICLIGLLAGIVCLYLL